MSDPLDTRATEKRLGRKGGGRQVPGSGAIFRLPGDFVWSRYGVLGESKETRKTYQSVSVEWLRRIAGEARRQSQEPVLVLTRHSMSEPFDKEWAFVRKPFLDQLLGASFLDGFAPVVHCPSLTWKLTDEYLVEVQGEAALGDREPWCACTFAKLSRDSEWILLRLEFLLEALDEHCGS